MEDGIVAPAGEPPAGQSGRSVERHPIVSYRPEFREAFERLNRVWLEEHDLLEPADVEYLQNPEPLILATGGQIFFALDGEKVAGTCAAIRISDATFELAK